MKDSREREREIGARMNERSKNETVETTNDSCVHFVPRST
jgi:hypothetical protein